MKYYNYLHLLVAVLDCRLGILIGLVVGCSCSGSGLVVALSPGPPERGRGLVGGLVGGAVNDTINTLHVCMYVYVISGMCPEFSKWWLFSNSISIQHTHLPLLQSY